MTTHVQISPALIQYPLKCLSKFGFQEHPQHVLINNPHPVEPEILTLSGLAPKPTKIKNHLYIAAKSSLPTKSVQHLQLVQ